MISFPCSGVINATISPFSIFFLVNGAIIRESPSHINGDMLMPFAVNLKGIPFAHIIFKKPPSSLLESVRVSGSGFNQYPFVKKDGY